jgi:dTDP-4-dehydrorhamnose reductase
VKILLTGANGQIGTEIRSLGVARNIELIATTSQQLNITDAQQIQAAISEQQPDVVINAAAYTAVDAAENDEAAAYAVNETGARNLAIACENQRCRLVHISTDFVFDGTSADTYGEDAPANPLNAYGKSKYAGEQAIREHCAQHVIVRTAWVFSPWAKNFMKTMLTLMEQGKTLNVVNDQQGSPTAAADAASALVEISRQLTESRNPAFGTYHYCGQGQTSWFGFATRIAQSWQDFSGKSVELSAIPTSEYPTPALRPQNSSLNCDRLQENFGITTVNWETATDREVRRYLNMAQGSQQ